MVEASLVPDEPDDDDTLRTPSSKRALLALIDPQWERQPNETSAQFQKFVAFRDTPPPRYLPELATRLGVTYGTLKAVAFRMRWTQRAGAWDDEKDRVNRAQQLESLRKMNERHANQAQAFQVIAMMPVQALGKRIREDKSVQDLPMMLPMELLDYTARMARVWTEMVQMERLARGETNAEVGVRQSEGDEIGDRIAKTPNVTRKLHSALYDLYVEDAEAKTGERPRDLPAPLVPEMDEEPEEPEEEHEKPDALSPEKEE